PEVAGTRTTCMTIQRGVAGEVADSRVAEAWPTSNYGRESVAFAGRVGPGARRMLVKFDLDSIPDSARITKATITLHRETCGCSNVTVHRATARWNERDVTWNSFADAYEDDALLSLPEGVNTEGDFGPVSFDATELVRGWRQGVDPNYGL